MAFPVVAATNTSNTAADGTAHTLNLPSAIAVGHLLIAIAQFDGLPVVTWPAGWTQIFAAVAGSSITLQARYRIATGSEGASIALTTDVAEKMAAHAYRITGHNPAIAPQAGVATSDITATSANPNPPLLAPTGGAKDYLWIACGGDRTNAVTAGPANYTNFLAASSGTGVNNNANLGSARRTLNAVSEDPGTFTLSAVERWIANTIAVHPEEGHKSGWGMPI